LLFELRKAVAEEAAVEAAVEEASGDSFYRKDLVFTIQISGYNGGNSGGGSNGEQQLFLLARACYDMSYFRLQRW
jgi:hypothetical protein